MAIQNRRGDYNDFDPTKLLPGEWAVVTQHDPNAVDGQAVYMCFDASGTVKRMATYEDMVDWVGAHVAHDAVAQEAQTQIGSLIDDCEDATEAANTAAGAASDAADDANTAAARAEAAAGGVEDPSNAVITFTEASERTNLTTGDKIKEAFGKIKKWFTDLKDGAFCEATTDLTVSTAGYVLDGRVGSTISNIENSINLFNGTLFKIGYAQTGSKSWTASSTTSATISLSSSQLPIGYDLLYAKPRNSGGSSNTPVIPVGCYFSSTRGTNGELTSVTITVRCRNGTASAANSNIYVDLIFVRNKYADTMVVSSIGNINS